MRIFLTGKPGTGKTTVLKKFLKMISSLTKPVGFLTLEIRTKGRRTGFVIETVPNGKKRLFASIEKIGDTRFGKYWLNLKALEASIEEIENNLEKCEVIVIDEIGKMEMLSQRFREFLEKILRCDKHLIATLHRSYVNDFKNRGMVIEVTFENRDELPAKLISYLNITHKSYSHEVRKD
jgi:nucleoside-triphosphatase